MRKFIASLMVAAFLVTGCAGYSILGPVDKENDTPESRLARATATMSAGLGIIELAFPEVKERVRKSSYALFQVMAGLQDAPITLDQLGTVVTIAIAASGHPIEAAIAKRWLAILKPVLMLHGIKSDGRVDIPMVNELGKRGMKMIDDNRALDAAIEAAKEAE